MTGWQPIKTVPIGEKVLIWNEEWGTVRMGSVYPNGWFVGDILQRFVPFKDRSNLGTHWHPLPAKPE